MWKNYRDLLIAQNLAGAQDMQKNSREKRVGETFLTKQPKGLDEARLQGCGQSGRLQQNFLLCFNIK